MISESRQRRSRVCYDKAKDEVKLKPNNNNKVHDKKIIDLQTYLSQKKEWISVIKYRWIALSILLLRARLFFTAFLIIFVLYSTSQYLLSNVDLELPLISVCLGILFVALQNFILKSHERIISLIEVDDEQLFVRAKYLTNWGVLRYRYATVESVMLTNYINLNGKATDLDESNLIWRETEWDGYLKIPVNGVQIVNQGLAMMLFGDLH